MILVEVTRLPGWTRKRQSLWLFYYGKDSPNLAVLWRAYVHRFDVEHTIRFFKQTLNWTMPRVRYPEQADRWSWLLLAAYTQLRLARSCVADRRLPWERRLEPDKLTPYRVRRVFRRFGWRSALQRMRQDPAVALRDVPRVADRDERRAIRP